MNRRLRAGLLAAIALLAAAAEGCNTPRPPAQKLPMELLKKPRVKAPAVAGAPGSIGGVVLGPDGAPIDFALVAAVPIAQDPEDGAPPFLTTTLKRGKFELTALPAGDYGLTVTPPAANGVASASADPPAGSFAGVVTVQSGAGGLPVLLRLGAGALVLRGHVTGDAGARLPGALVRAVRESPFEGDHFFAKTDHEGKFVLPVPAGRYFLVGQAAGRRPVRVDLDMGHLAADIPVALPPEPPLPSREEVAAWVTSTGGALSLADSGASDLAPLRAMAGKARVVALGEASYTGGDFARLKLRMLQHLVEKMGFSTLLLEAGRAEVRALDDYVLHGKGKLKELVIGLGDYHMDTQEMIAVFSWMRRYNEDPSHRTKLRLAGLDVQRTAAAAAGVAAYLESVDRTLLPPVETTLDRLRLNDVAADLRRRPADEQDKVLEDVESIAAALEKNRRVYNAKGYTAYEAAREDAALLVWAARVQRDERRRGEAMADMARRTVDGLGAGSRAVVWAHNAQVSKREAELGMGSFLARAYGADYISVGMVFHEGSIRAWDFSAGPTLERGTKLFRLSPAPGATLEGLLDMAGVPFFLADVRRAPPALAAWLGVPLSTWSVGVTFVNERRARARTVAGEAFDGIVFVKKLTSATFTDSAARPGVKD